MRTAKTDQTGQTPRPIGLLGANVILLVFHEAAHMHMDSHSIEPEMWSFV